MPPEVTRMRRPAQQPAPGSDRYGLGAANPIDRSLPDAATPPVEPTFTDAWAVIQTALDRGELARAHQLLSQWYGDDSLTPAEARKGRNAPRPVGRHGHLLDRAPVGAGPRRAAGRNAGFDRQAIQRALATAGQDQRHLRRRRGSTRAAVEGRARAVLGRGRSCAAAN